VAASGQSILIGNSTEPGGPVLSYSRQEWQEFVTGIKKGKFDDLLNDL
jgi:hypothetical protein